MSRVVYVGNLDPRAYERDLEYEFGRYGRIRDIWVAKNPPGFGLIEFDHPYDVQDAIHGSDGRWLLDRRMIVQSSNKQIQRGRNDRDRRDGRDDGRRGGRDDDRRGGRDSGRNFEKPIRGPKSNPARTEFRVKFTDLCSKTTWQKLKDTLRNMKSIPVYCDTYGDGTGMADLRSDEAADFVIKKLDGSDIDGVTIHCARDYEPISIGVLEIPPSQTKDNSKLNNRRDHQNKNPSRDRSRSRDRHGEKGSAEPTDANTNAEPVALVEAEGDEVDYEDDDHDHRRGRGRSRSASM